MLTLAVDAPIHLRSTDEEVEKTLFKIYCDNATRFLLFFVPPPRECNFGAAEGISGSSSRRSDFLTLF